MEKSRRGTKRTARRQTKKVDYFEQNKAPFQEKWINECYEKLIFPNQNCVAVMEKINRVLPRHVVKSQSSEQKQQALLQLLGEHFSEQHFPNTKIRKELLEPPKMNLETKEKYLTEMKSFLKKALIPSLEDCGYATDVSQHTGKDDELSKYLQEIKSTFKDAFSTHVTLDAFDVESKKLLKEKELAEGMSNIKRDDDDDSYGSDTESPNPNSGLNQDIGLTHTYEGDSAAKAFLAFMAHDNSKEEYYKNIIRDQFMCLPITLRQNYWYGFFITKEIQRLKLIAGDNYEKAIETDFSTKMKQQMKENKISRSSRGPNAKYIDSHIVVTFGGAFSFEEYDTDNLMIKAAVAVNMADIHSRNYTPINSLLVVPLLATYPNNGKDENDDYEEFIATHLNLVVNYCKLSPYEIFKLSNEIIEIVKDQDPEYFNYICSGLANQTSKSKPIDFTPEVFLEDTTAGTKIFNNLISKGRREAKNIQERYEETLIDPTLYIRKWIGQIFVGILSLNTMMWAWDQLFMRDWSRETIKNIGLCILALLKPWMYRAKMHSGVRKVLIEEPSKLYTSDLRDAVDHLEKGGLFTQIPSTKNYMEVKESSRKKQEAKEEKRPPRIAVPVKSFSDHEDFYVDIDFTMDTYYDYEPEPIPEPKPDDPDTDSDDDDNFARPRDPNEPDTPPETPPPELTKTAWLEKDSIQIIPVESCRINEPFDIYVDYVRFLPDHIIVCKVVGRIMNSGLSKGKVKDITAFPMLESYRTSPSFKFKLNVDPQDNKIKNNATLIFKVYGYQDTSNEVVVVGSCLLGLYTLVNNKFMLKTGGHQLRLRHGGPDTSKGITNLHESDMNHNSLIPGTSICIRLLEASKVYDPTPSYEEAYYESNSAKPNVTEKRLFEHYINMEDYGTLRVKDVLRRIQKRRQESQSKDDDQLQKFMEKILNHTTAQNKRRGAIPDLDYAHYVSYDKKMGLNVCVQGAFGFPESIEDYYIHAFGEYYPGKDTISYVSESDMSSYRAITRRLDLDSPRRSPDWLDLKTTIYPPYDEFGVFLIRIYGIRPKYIPLNDENDEDDEDDNFLDDLKGALDGEVEDEDEPGSSAGGVVKPRDRDAFYIDYEGPLYWGVLPAFSKECAFGGLHSIALFDGSPVKDMIDEFQSKVPVDVLKKWISRGSIRPESKSLLEVEIWDGHVESEDIPEPASEIQLDSLGIRSSANESRSRDYNLKYSDFVFENMSKTGRKKGTSSSKYIRESYIFQKEANRQLVISLNAALRYSGKTELKYS